MNGYVAAGYGLTLVVLAGYAAYVVRRARRLGAGIAADGVVAGGKVADDKVSGARVTGGEATGRRRGGTGRTEVEA